MIREFSVKPKPSNNKARAAFIISMMLSFALILLSTLIESYKGIIGLGGVAFLTIAMVFYTKYISPIWFYDITFDSDGTPVFVVRQQIGKRQTTLCRIALCEIVKIDRENSHARREHKTPAGVIRYSYLPTLDPKDSYRITTSARHERAELLIECSEEFAGLLQGYSVEAREKYVDIDEY
ncbi:MAG: hypothetical protein IJW93_00155 [Clostridia bacterium]|nr:hypothetical protein [Clostridia bacterium]